MSPQSKRTNKRDKSKKSSWNYAILFGLALAGLAVFAVHESYLNVKSQSPEWKTRFRPDFPGLEDAASLSDEKKEWVVQQANREVCSCECGYTLASCLKVDLSCPLRPKNLERVSELIQKARRSDKPL